MARKVFYISILVMILLSACGGSPAATNTVASLPQAPAEMFNKTWQWQELRDMTAGSTSPVPGSSQYVIAFLPSGDYNFTADCNSGSGKYTISGVSIKLEPGPMTLADCGPTSLANNYLTLLGQVNSYYLEGEYLQLMIEDNYAMMFGSGDAALATPQAIPSGAPDPASVTMNLSGLASAYKAEFSGATDFVPGVSGLPEHVKVTFEGVPQAALYIIPVAQYQKMWDVNGDPTVSSSLIKLGDLLTEKPSPINSWGLPALPLEEAAGVNDLAVQGSYLSTPVGNGLRFVGRFSQDLSPVTNGQLDYIYQGFTTDGKYLVALYFPVTAAGLPAQGQASPEEVNQASQSSQEYLTQKAQQLNGLRPEDFTPGLSALDALISSLQFQSAP